MPAKFSTGDKVRIIHGSMDCWVHKDYITDKDIIISIEPNGYMIDGNPELIGLEALIESTKYGRNNEWQYSIFTKERGSVSWFRDEQLELISKNNNTL